MEPPGVLKDRGLQVWLQAAPLSVGCGSALNQPPFRAPHAQVLLRETWIQMPLLSSLGPFPLSSLRHWAGPSPGCAHCSLVGSEARSPARGRTQ